jgi:hypothetical protein
MVVTLKAFDAPEDVAPGALAMKVQPVPVPVGITEAKVAVEPEIVAVKP